ncbi:MAG: zinc ribbon domain-containing protein [Thaumarchaeota archaeon]|nr:zinc ribbon domain-containing protein [Candidatus Calditenuaceae archaeon]MDW8186986.1 zinc ribbon domain-containing protein [Nitrososphaerota archaeon]
MWAIALGYFLCVLNALPFVVFTLFPVALVSYPISIALRAFGWRRIGRSLGRSGIMFPLYASLGTLTFVLVVAELTQLAERTLALAAIPWTVYSVLDAYWYFKLGTNYGIRSFYAALVGMGGVVYVDFVLLQAALVDPPPYQASPEAFVGSLVLTGLLLMVSGVAAGVSFLGVGHVMRGSEALIKGPRVVPRVPVSSSTASSSQVPPAPFVGGKVKVLALSTGTSLICSKCGSESAIESLSCTSCGHRFNKVSYGLRCPVCSAPLSSAKRISVERFVCQQCFSDLSVVTV